MGYNGHDLGTLKVLGKVLEKLYELLHPCEAQSHFDFYHSLKHCLCLSTGYSMILVHDVILLPPLI